WREASVAGGRRCTPGRASAAHPQRTASGSRGPDLSGAPGARRGTAGSPIPSTAVALDPACCSSGVAASGGGRAGWRTPLSCAPSGGALSRSGCRPRSWPPSSGRRRPDVSEEPR
ncbi:MAG: hypothetical protein AVDCRST_MAG24-48, partial [uncultured Nocardioidaceae bacterium]